MSSDPTLGTDILLKHESDTGYRAVDELPAGEDDYDPKHKFPHCPAFKQIGNLRGPFDLGLIPIGAYDPVSSAFLKPATRLVC